MSLEAQLLQIIEQQQQQLKEQQKQQEQALQFVQAQNRTISELENYNSRLVKHCTQLSEKESELTNIIKKLQNPKLSQDLLQNLENSLKQRLQSHLDQLVTGLQIETRVKQIIAPITQSEIETQLRPMGETLRVRLEEVNLQQRQLSQLIQDLSIKL